MILILKNGMTYYRHNPDGRLTEVTPAELASLEGRVSDILPMTECEMLTLPEGWEANFHRGVLANAQVHAIGPALAELDADSPAIVERSE